MALERDESVLLAGLHWDIKQIIEKAEGEKDLRVIANLYRDMADHADAFADKVEELHND